jgi:hypothetical protein
MSESSSAADYHPNFKKSFLAKLSRFIDFAHADKNYKTLAGELCEDISFQNSSPINLKYKFS